MKSTLLIIAFFLIVSSCKTSNDDTQTPIQPQTLMTFNIDPAVLQQDVDYWLMIHDNDGKLLASQKLTNEKQIVFDTAQELPDGKLGVTISKY